MVKEDEELRWDPSSESHSLFVSISFVYLSKRRMQQFFTTDLITTLGVTGGILLLFKFTYDVLIFAFSYVLKDEESEQYDYMADEERQPVSSSATGNVEESRSTNEETVNIVERSHAQDTTSKNVYDEL